MTAEGPLPYFYRLAVPPGHAELAEMELRALAGRTVREGADPAERVRWGRAGVDVRSGAFVAEVCHLLARAPDCEGLVAATAKLALGRERFRITLRKLGGQSIADGHRVQVALADVMEGRPDLERPACEYVVIAREGAWLLGELVSRSDSGWRGHEQRPHQYSIALPTRTARALVNLVARPSDSLLDPCCGVGTVLVEAGQMGVTATGYEISPRIAEHARCNICHWGVEAQLTTGDGRGAEGVYHGAVVDLPYGHASERVEVQCRELVARTAQRCRLLAVVSADDMTGFLRDLGLELLGLARVPKGSLVRHVHWAYTGSTGR